MIKLLDILKEIGEASKAFTTQRTSQGQSILFTINDENFPIDNFNILISLGEKDDIIKFKNNDSFFMAKIIKIIKYSTFEEYLSQEGLARTLPGIKTIKEGIDIYYKYYTPEQEKEFGILAIYVKLL